MILLLPAQGPLFENQGARETGMVGVHGAEQGQRMRADTEDSRFREILKLERQVNDFSGE